MYLVDPVVKVVIVLSSNSTMTSLSSIFRNIPVCVVAVD